jgi:hypothetical protein
MNKLYEFFYSSTTSLLLFLAEVFSFRIEAVSLYSVHNRANGHMFSVHYYRACQLKIQS